MTNLIFKMHFKSINFDNNNNNNNNNKFIHFNPTTSRKTEKRSTSAEKNYKYIKPNSGLIVTA